jgi:hypothetical protein
MAADKPKTHRKPDGERRSEQLHLRISPRDRAVFIAAARKSRLEDVSIWARIALLNAAEALDVTYETVAAQAAGEPPPTPPARGKGRQGVRSDGVSGGGEGGAAGG